MHFLHLYSHACFEIAPGQNNHIGERPQSDLCVLLWMSCHRSDFVLFGLFGTFGLVVLVDIFRLFGLFGLLDLFGLFNLIVVDMYGLLGLLILFGLFIHPAPGTQRGSIKIGDPQVLIFIRTL